MATEVPGFPELSDVSYSPAAMLPVIERARRAADETLANTPGLRPDWHPLVTDRLDRIARAAALFASLSQSQFTFAQLVEDQEWIWQRQQQRAGKSDETPHPMYAVPILLQEAISDSMLHE